MSISRTSRRQLVQMVAVGATAFVSRSVYAAASASLPPIAIGRPFPAGVELPSTPPDRSTSNSIGVALVGLGQYALGRIAPALSHSKHCHLAGLVSGNPTKARRVAAVYGLSTDQIYDYDNFDRISSDDRIAALYILLPSGLHADWTEHAFAAGKHVLCEKPMALNSIDCERMIAASRRAQRKLMIAYRCHFEPNNLRAMALMRKQAVGDIQLIRADQHYVIGNATPANNWRVNAALAGGGALEDYGIYGLQSALYLTDEMPTSVSATISTPSGSATFSEIPNLVASRLKFPSGAVAQLSSSYNASWNDRVEVRGNNGIMMQNPATGYDGLITTLSQSPQAGELERIDATVQFAEMLDHFGSAVAEDRRVLTDGNMGLRDIRIIEAIYAAAKRGVQIELGPNGAVRT